jgi:hypothetical protein
VFKKSGEKKEELFPWLRITFRSGAQFKRERERGKNDSSFTLDVFALA